MLMGFRLMPKKRLFCLFMAFTILLSSLTGGGGKENEAEKAYNAELLASRLSSLWEDISTDSSLVVPEGDVTLFLSICNRTEQAKVLHVIEPDLKTAWESAASQASSLVSKESLSPMWVKADIVVKKGNFPLSAVKQDLNQSLFIGLGLRWILTWKPHFWKQSAMQTGFMTMRMMKYPKKLSGSIRGKGYPFQMN